MLKMFGALPAYFGGKRRLAKQIMQYAEGKVFIDAFMGGGSVALLAKARGFGVQANDIADRSAIVGRALIENRDTYIEAEDIARLFWASANDRHYIRDHQGHMFKAGIGEFLDRARANIDEIREETKRAVMMLLWVRVIMYYRPMGSFTHPRAVEKLEAGEATTETLQQLEEKYSRPLYSVLESISEDINAGVFDNGLENQFCQKDVCEFLRSTAGDTVYLDPPYYGAQSYEHHYSVLDQIIAGRDFEPRHSVFNTKQVISNTLKLLESSQHIPVWIMSVGERIIDKKKYVEMMGDFRQVEDIPVKHAHFYGFGFNENAGGQEVLLVGRPK